MRIGRTACSENFTEYCVSKSSERTLVDDEPRYYGGMYNRIAENVSISHCGSYWCFVVTDVRTDKVVIVEGVDVERASYIPSSRRVTLLTFTPHTTVLVRPTFESCVTEIDVDGRELRRIDVSHECFSIVCTPTLVVLVTLSTYEVYAYASGAHLSTFDTDVDKICLHSLAYSPFTRRLYVQNKAQMSAREVFARSDGTLQLSDGPPIVFEANMPVGLHHWCIVDDEQVVLLRDFERKGICFRDVSVRCHPFNIMRLVVIPGGFFIYSSTSAYFYLDRFSYTRKELFIRMII